MQIDDFLPGKDELNETVLLSDGNYDIFIARYNPDGTLEWSKRAGGTGNDYGVGCTLLSDNTVVITGWIRDLATFGQGESNETVLTSAGSDDIFIARYNSDGLLLWAKRAGGETSYYDRGAKITSRRTTESTAILSIPPPINRFMYNTQEARNTRAGPIW